MYTIISCGLTVAVVYYGLAMLACRQCKCHCHCLHATVLLLVHVIELHIATLPSMDRQTDAWERLSTCPKMIGVCCCYNWQRRIQSLDQGRLIFFLLSSLSPVPLFSFFLLFTMPKFFREACGDSNVRHGGRGAGAPLPPRWLRPWRHGSCRCARHGARHLFSARKVRVELTYWH